MALRPTTKATIESKPAETVEAEKERREVVQHSQDSLKRPAADRPEAATTRVAAKAALSEGKEAMPAIPQPIPTTIREALRPREASKVVVEARAQLKPGTTLARVPSLHGKLSVTRGDKVVPGEQGYREWPDLRLELTLADGRKLLLQSDFNQRSEIFLGVPGTDIMAFDGMDVSVRGWFDQSGASVRVTEFAPGHVDDFVTGRVVVQGDRVFVQPRGRDPIEVTHPALKRELSARANLGVILPGVVVETALGDKKQLSFDENPEGYWMLVRFTEAPAPSAEHPEISHGSFVAATSRVNPTITLPTNEVSRIEVGDRMYVFGRFDDSGQVKATKATRSAGSPWLVASAPRGEPIKTP